MLTKKTEKIEEITEDIKKLAQSMVETMHNAPGIGLAAPQVGESIRLITVDLSVGEKEDNLIILINPEIVEQEGESIQVEGCLSVPEVNEKISRPARIVIRGCDLEGQDRVIEAEDTLARAFCHEIDHLDGTLIIDHLSPLKKTLARKNLKKMREKGEI